MSGTPVILIVEDSRTQAVQLQRQLREHGVEVIVASDGLEGLKMATQYIPDMIVLDMKLPKMDGVQVCQRLKRHKDTSHIPVIMLSSADDAENTLAGLNAGAEDYIPKDIFAASYLLDTLRSFGLV